MDRFVRYFYGELNQLANNRSSLRNIFIDPHRGKLQLRNDVSIHLVLSDAANGDARDYLPPETNSYLNAYDAVRSSRTAFKFHFGVVQAQMRMTAHAPVYETAEQGLLKYKYQEGESRAETIDETYRNAVQGWKQSPRRINSSSV